MSTLSRSSTRKIIGSLAIAGTAAAVAGLGTFGTFTSSTTPVTTQLSSGTVAIDLAAAAGSAAIPATTSGFVPGDSMSRAVDLTNSGDTALGSVTLTSTSSTSNALTTDPTDGLQLSVRSCPVAWTQGGTPAAPTYTCSGTASSLFTGPAVASSVLPDLKALAPGGVDHLVLTIALPTDAGNAFQNLTAALDLTFTGVQRTGGAR